MDCKLTPAEINHLRRLIGWAACEVGQSPEEMVATVKMIAPAVHDASEEGKARLVQAHQTASNVPKYVRAAIKALRKAIEPHLGDVVDADYSQERQLPAPNVELTGSRAGLSPVSPESEANEVERRVGGCDG